MGCSMCRTGGGSLERNFESGASLAHDNTLDTARCRYLVNTIAPQLLKRHIWVEEVLWRGFIVFCSQSIPACFELLLQLPPKELETCLSDKKMADKGVRSKLADHVSRVTSHNFSKAMLKVIGL